MGAPSRPQSAWFMLALTWAASACQQPMTGGQTGDGADFGDQPGEPTADLAIAQNCHNQAIQIDSADATLPELGFKASDVLELVEGTHTTSLGWVLHSAFGRAAPSDDTVEIEVRYEGGPIVQNTFEPELAGAAAELAGAETSEGDAVEPGCPPRVDVSVVVAVRSSDGAFALEFTTDLHASSVDAASFTQRLPGEEFDGTLELQVPDAELTGYEIGTTFVEYGVTGTLDALVRLESERAALEVIDEEVSGESAATRQVAGQPYPIAVWPDSVACAPEDPWRVPQGIRIDAGTELRFVELEAALGVFERAAPLPMTWQDQQTTELHLELEREGELCVRPSVAHERVFYAAKLRASTADGRLDATHAARVSIEGTPYGSASSLSVMLPDVDSAQAASQFGMPQLDLAEVEQASFNLLLSAADHGVSGSLSVLAAMGCERSAAADDGLREPLVGVCPVEVESARIGDVKAPVRDETSR